MCYGALSLRKTMKEHYRGCVLFPVNLQKLYRRPADQKPSKFEAEFYHITKAAVLRGVTRQLREAAKTNDEEVLAAEAHFNKKKSNSGSQEKKEDFKF